MKPNLIYIFADQLRYQSVGYSGDKRAKTPNIDRLCFESTNLCNAVSGHPVCAPYRASLFTGKYTTSTGMVINEVRMNPNHHTFADVLNENNYNTCYIGKWHMYAAELGNHYDPDNSFIPKGRDRLGFDGYFASYNFHHNYYGAAAYYHLDSREKIYVDGYEPDVHTDMALQQMEQLSAQDRPFAMFLSLGTPHDPWVPENIPGEVLERFKEVDFELPENYQETNDPYADDWAKLSSGDRQELKEWIRVYYAMVSNLDDNIGRIMDKITELGLDDDSIIVFTSDHGEMFGAHGRRAKNIFYEEAVRVPFLIRWKGKLKENETNDVCLNTVDIMPTLLSMMGLPIPEEVEGSDLTEYIKGVKENDAGALLMGTGATAIFEDGHEWRAWRTKRYTYAQYLINGKELLFDHQKDPLQMKNLASSVEYKDVKQKLRNQMLAKMSEIGDTFEPCSYYQDHWIENRIIKRTATLK